MYLSISLGNETKLYNPNAQSDPKVLYIYYPLLLITSLSSIEMLALTSSSLLCSHCLSTCLYLSLISSLLHSFSRFPDQVMFHIRGPNDLLAKCSNRKYNPDCSVQNSAWMTRLVGQMLISRPYYFLDYHNSLSRN